jgi:hypothetical protein
VRQNFVVVGVELLNTRRRRGVGGRGRERMGWKRKEERGSLNRMRQMEVQMGVGMQDLALR